MARIRDGKQQEDRGRDFVFTDLGLGDDGGVVDDDDGPGRHDDGHPVHAGERLEELLHERHLRRAADPQHVEVALLQLAGPRRSGVPHRNQPTTLLVTSPLGVLVCVCPSFVLQSKPKPARE